MKWICLLAILSIPAHAGAHGAFPVSRSIGFGPGTGGVLLGTNFGGVLRAPDGGLQFICELAVTGFTQSVGPWLWLTSGAVVGVVVEGGFSRGVFVSDADACSYGTVPGTDAWLMTDLVQDAVSDAFFATGSDEAGAVLLRGRPDGADVRYLDTLGSTAVGVRAGAGHAYAVFARIGAATLVHDDGDHVTTVEHTFADDGTLRPIGVSPNDPTTLWLARTTATGDTLFMSHDAGVTMTPVMQSTAPIGGFAATADVVWVQDARSGVYRSDDGGLTFARLPDSPIGNCLAVAPDGRLYACGVPWQDGFALGVSDDGRTFQAVVPFFDDIAGPIDCPSAPNTTATCTDELAFLRDYYGFATPVVPADDAPEASPEPTPEASPERNSEPPLAPEPAPDAAPPAGDGGCAATQDRSWLAIVAALGCAWVGRRRYAAAR